MTVATSDQRDGGTVAFVVAAVLAAVPAVMTALIAGHWHAAGVVAVAGYGLYGFLSARRQPTRAATLSENAYLLGYLATMLGLAAVAVRISLDPGLLNTARIPAVLLDGALALLSTLVGLVFMTVIKSQAYHLQTPRDVAEEMIARLLPQFAEQLERAVEKTTATRDVQLLEAIRAGDLAEQMGALVKTLRSGTDSVGSLEQASVQAVSTLDELGRQMSNLNAAVQRFGLLSEALRPAWTLIAETAQQTPPVAEHLTRAATSLADLDQKLAAAGQQTSAYTAVLKTCEDGLIASARTLQERLDRLPAYVAAMERLVGIAERAAPTLGAVGETFSDVENLRKNLKELGEYVGHFNIQITSAGTSTLKLAESNEELRQQLDLLVNNVANQMHALDRLRDPVNRLADTAPRLEALQPGIQHLLDFGICLEAIGRSLRELDQSLKVHKEQLDEIAGVMRNYEEASRTFKSASFLTPLKASMEPRPDNRSLNLPILLSFNELGWIAVFAMGLFWLYLLANRPADLTEDHRAATNRLAQLEQNNSSLSNELTSLRQLRKGDVTEKVALIEARDLATHEAGRLRDQVAAEGAIRREILNLAGPMSNVVVLLDRSRSMAEGDRWQETLGVVSNWLEHLRIANCAVIAFGSECRAIPERGLLPMDEQNRRRLLDAIGRLQPEGKTATVQAFELAYRYPNLDTIVLFTDGEPYLPPAGDDAPRDDVAQRSRESATISERQMAQVIGMCAARTNIPVNVVAVANYFDKKQSDFLLKLARTTRGAFLGR